MTSSYWDGVDFYTYWTPDSDAVVDFAVASWDGTGEAHVRFDNFQVTPAWRVAVDMLGGAGPRIDDARFHA